MHRGQSTDGTLLRLDQKHLCMITLDVRYKCLSSNSLLTQSLSHDDATPSFSRVEGEKQAPNSLIPYVTETPNPKPQTPNPKPQTPNPNPKPQTQTLNSKPQTLNPKP